MWCICFEAHVWINTDLNFTLCMPWLDMKQIISAKWGFCLGYYYFVLSWWRHHGNIFRITRHLWGNSPIPGEFPAQRPVTRSFDLFFDLRPNKRLSKQSWSRWFDTPSRPSWRHRNDNMPEFCCLRSQGLDLNLHFFVTIKTKIYILAVSYPIRSYCDTNREKKETPRYERSWYELH